MITIYQDEQTVAAYLPDTQRYRIWHKGKLIYDSAIATPFLTTLQLYVSPRSPVEEVIIGRKHCHAIDSHPDGITLGFYRLRYPFRNFEGHVKQYPVPMYAVVTPLAPIVYDNLHDARTTYDDYIAG